MLRSRTLRFWLLLSLLLHLAASALFPFLAGTPRRPEEAVVVELADIPRSTEFLPPRAGIIQGARPKAAPPAAPPEERKVPEDEVLRGRVPDLPVSPDLPPEKEFPAVAEKPPEGKPEPPGERKPPGGAEERTARAASPQPAPAREAEREPPSRPGGSRKAIPDLTPSLGGVVIAMRDRGAGRGREDSEGTAAGTGGKPAERGALAEERGGGTHLTPLNAPEIQYISYFAGIKRKIELVWQYPYDAQVQGIQGDLRIDFVIRRDGTLDSAVLVRGSGHRILDDEALRAIRAAAPFAPIPARYDIPHLAIRAHFVYEMHTLKLR